VDLNFATVTGTVYDETGKPLSGATVKIAKIIFEGDDAAVTGTTGADGKYSVAKVPAGANVEISATKDGYTWRRRVGAFDALPPVGQAGQPYNVVNFGGTDAFDAGRAYFISSYPEVTKVEHVGDTVLFTLSEALDDVNRRRFEEAVRLVPSDTAAGATGPNAIARATAGVSFTWSADNLTATMKFASGTLTAPSYVAVLAASGTDRVVDKGNDPLGQAADGNWTGTLAADERVRAVFKRDDLALQETDTTGPKRWAATHKDSATI
jgi:hypothetical protein